MTHAYTSGLRVSSRTVVRKTRRLPLRGEVLVQTGDRVGPDTVVAETYLPGPVHNVNVSNTLAIAAEDVPDRMRKQPGDAVEEGDLIAESKGIFGRFKSSVRSSVAGTVELVSAVTGQVLIRGPSVPIRIKAHIDGKIAEVLPSEGVVVETTGACIQGIFGIGGEIHAPLRVMVDSSDAKITADMIDEACAGRIVCGGSCIALDALRKLIDVGAAGVVVGGVQYRDIANLLGYQIGVAVTGSEDIGLTLVVTEGFGPLPMAERTFGLIGSLDGRDASMSGATQIRAGVIRPEIVISGDQHDDESGPPSPVVRQGLEPGTAIRLIRKPWFGEIATVASLPEQPARLPTGAVTRILEARRANGEIVTVPRANVEIIEA